MKHSILFLFVFSISHLNAQSVILLEQDSVSQIIENADLSDNFIDFALDLYFKNNTEDSISVNWRREFGENCPTEWDVITIDQIISYIPQIDESQIPIPLSPTDSNFIVREIFLPRTVPGCCDIRMIFSLEGSPANPIDTGYYHIEINSDGCFATSIFEENIDQFNIYPNPVSDVLNMESSHLVESIEIIDLTGRTHFQKAFPDLYRIDVSSLQSGLYYCKIKGHSGKLWIEKIIKE